MSGFDDAILLGPRFGRITGKPRLIFPPSKKRHSNYSSTSTPKYFPGITRDTLLDVAQSLGIEVERDVRP